MKNHYEKNYKYIYTFFLQNFTAYNKENSWSSGDIVLKNIALVLKNYFTDSLVFRVFGDDFVVLCREEVILDELKRDLDEIIRKNNLEYRVKSIDISKIGISSVEDIENFKL
jgi:GGDEF domain-containing protein